MACESVSSSRLAVASSLTGGLQRGWRLGRFGIPYKVSGGSDVERRGWVITMHAAGTAIRSGPGRASPQVKTSMRMRTT